MNHNMALLMLDLSMNHDHDSVPSSPKTQLQYKYCQMHFLKLQMSAVIIR